jgi:hypothetical protein
LVNLLCDCGKPKGFQATFRAASREILERVQVERIA